MSVNSHLLSVDENELASVLKDPEYIKQLVELRKDDVCFLGPYHMAIIALTIDNDKDPLGFLWAGAFDDTVSGYVGRYTETRGHDPECEVDMGYGPASYYRHRFIVTVAQRLKPITPDIFKQNCDMDWLEDNHVYPSGWRDDEWRKTDLIDSFIRYRECVLVCAEKGNNLLVWFA